MPAILLPGSSKNNGRPLKPGLAARVDREHPLSTGLVGCWLFNEGGGAVVRNLALQGRANGTFAASGVTWSTSKFGRGVAFTGASPTIDITTTDETELNCPSGYTLEVWVYLNATGSVQLIAGKGTLDVFNVYYNGTHFESDVEFSPGGGTNYSGAVSATTPAATTWYHVVGTWDGTTAANGIKIYVNGKLDGQGTLAGTAMSASGTPFYIGGGPDTVNDPALNGKLDLVRVWKRPLSLDNITKLFNQPFINIVGQSPRYITVPATTGGNVSAPANTSSGKASTQSTTGVTRSLTSSAFARASAASTLAAIKAMTSVILGKASTSSALKATKSVTSTPTGRAATTTQLSATKAVTSQGKGAASTTTGQMTATKAVSGSSAGKAGTSSQLAATKQMAASASSGKAQTTTAITRTVTLVSTIQGRGATTVSAAVTRSVTTVSTGRASTAASFTITKAVFSATNGRARTQSALAVTVALPASVSRGSASTVSAGVVGTGGGTVQAPPSTSRGSARVVSNCTVTRTISGQVQGRSIISQSKVNVTRTMAASTSKGQAQVAASVSVSRTFTTRAAGRAFTLSSVSVTLSVQAIASGRARVITGQIQVAKQLTSGVQARARLTSGVNLQKFLSGLSQGRARTVSGFSVIQPITFYPFRPLVVITEAPRPVATIAEVSRPVATIAANASVPVSKIVQAPGPVATITDVTRPTATISEVKP